MIRSLPRLIVSLVVLWHPAAPGRCGLPTFPALQESVTASSAVGLPAIRDELLRRAEKDQAIRNQLISGGSGPQVIAELRRVDKENRLWLEPLVEKHGWLGTSKVGKDGAHAAWLLVQHADQDPGFQRQCLDRMSALGNEEVNLTNVAYLTDRVLLAEGKPQRYGTQFSMQDGKLTMQPCEDLEKLNQRRRSVGLTTIEEYRKTIEQVYRQKDPEAESTSDRSPESH